jgi:hypothetical protein
VNVRFRITFHDDTSVNEYVCRAASIRVRELYGLDDDVPDHEDAMQDRLHDQISRWVSDGASITVEFDTDAGTAVVVPRH